MSSINIRDKTHESAAKPAFVGSLTEIEEFCARLSRHTGRIYRLPSEAEWEYACRAETTTLFHFGNTLPPTYANYSALTHISPSFTDTLNKQVYGRGTEPVGSFKVANAFGLCDMHGNAYELCADLWHEGYEGAPTDGRIWQIGGDDTKRVMRGGHWCGYAWHCRSSYRHAIELNLCRLDSGDTYLLGASTGFRIAVST